MRSDRNIRGLIRFWRRITANGVAQCCVVGTRTVAISPPLSRGEIQPAADRLADLLDDPQPQASRAPLLADADLLGG